MSTSGISNASLGRVKLFGLLVVVVIAGGVVTGVVGVVAVVCEYPLAIKRVKIKVK